MFLVIPFLFASHIVVVVVVAGEVVQSRPVTRFERPRALRLVDISLCGHVDVVFVVVAFVVVLSTIFNCVRGDFF